MRVDKYASSDNFLSPADIAQLDYGIDISNEQLKNRQNCFTCPYCVDNECSLIPDNLRDHVGIDKYAMYQPDCPIKNDHEKWSTTTVEDMMRKWAKKIAEEASKCCDFSVRNAVLSRITEVIDGNEITITFFKPEKD